MSHPQWTPRLLTAGRVLSAVIAGGFFIIPIYTFLLRGARYDARFQDSRRPDCQQVGSPQVREQAGQSGQPPALRGHRRRHRPRRRLGGGVARRARLPRQAVRHPRQPAPRAQHRRQGGINAAKGYRNDGDSIYRLFYDTVKGGDYRAREANVYRLAQLSVQIIDQCVAQGVPFAREWRPARQPVVRRRPGLADLLCPGADRPAAAARRLPVDDAAGGRRHGDALPPARDARPGRGQRPGPRHCLPQPGDRGTRVARRARGPAVHRRLRDGVLSLDQRRQLERDGGLARPQARCVLRQPLLHADSSDLHPRERRPPVEADVDVREPAQRRARVGAEEPGRSPPGGADSRGGSRLLPGAALSELRQPRPARRGVQGREGGL